MKKIQVFTSSAINYLPKVRLLCQSIKRHHPEWHLTWAVADRLPPGFDLASGLVDQLISIQDLDIPNKDGWVFSHNIAELSTAIKPFVAKYLLADPQSETILYFDPDIVLFSRLDDLVRELEQHSILLTPHQTTPEKKMEAIIDNEICSLRHGVFNLGFLGIRNDENGHAFTQWWADRLYHFCYESLDQHLWTDQKWINFAPIFFEGVRILKSSRFNVAPWNMTTRTLTGSFAHGFSVDGAPLGFYHFTGFDSGAHKIMATKYAGDNRSVMELVRWYEDEDRRCADEEISKLPWAFSRFDNGDPITKAHRFIYRSRRDLQGAYPNPFATDQTRSNEAACSYREWFDWRAAEDYPEFVPGKWQDDVPSAVLARVSARQIMPDWDRLRVHLRLSVKNRRYARLMIRRIWQVFREGGIVGLISNLRRHREKPV